MRYEIMNDSPIFIIGSERSGSNLLRSLLSNHSHMEGPIAPHFLDGFWKLSSFYGDLRYKENGGRLFADMLELANHPYHNWQLEVKFDGIFDKYHPQSFFDFFDILYKEKALMHGKKRYICKSNHVFNYAPMLMDRFPGAKFIYLYRDPRDHVASWVKNPLFLKTPYDAIRKWNEEQIKCQEIMANGQNRFFSVKYEDLITNTERVMTDLLLSFDEPVEIACFNTDIKRNQQVIWNKYWKNLSKPIIKNNMGKYQKYLNFKSLNMVETISRENMIKLGYRMETKGNWHKPYFHSIILKLRRKYVDLKYRNHMVKDMKMLHDKMDLLARIKSRVKKLASL